MNRIIATILSVIVGLFGYVIVDSTIESRVSDLESRVAYLESVVEEYHDLTISVSTTATTSPSIPNTTRIPSTTSVYTTSPAETTSTTAVYPAGVFVIRSYGWGHGVGMSQQGAIQMSRDGYTYDEILTHYYSGTTVKTDYSTPLTVRYGGRDIPIVEYLCKSTHREISASSPTEALKAQAAAIYTFAKYYDFDVPSSQHAYAENFDYYGTNLHSAVLSLLGMNSDSDIPKAKYVDYNGSAAFTCYFASSAGKTTSATDVWGGTGYPYLDGGVTSSETVTVEEKIITVDQMRNYITSYAADNGLSITLSNDPAEWLEIVSHDRAVNSGTGYVTKIRVGNREIRGYTFRCYILDFAIKSHCFTFEYIPE